jgi:hypothetical protein
MQISQENKKLLTNVGIVLAAYLVVVRPLFQKLGIVKTSDEIKKEKTEAANIEEVEKNLNARGIDLSKSKAEWDEIANTIYNNLRFSAIADNKADAGYQVARVQNDADVIYLIKTFGKRQEYLFGIPSGSPMGLTEFITSNLTRENINLINDNYKRKGIKFRF